MEYFCPSDFKETFSLLNKYGEGAIPIAGTTFFMAHREELFDEVEAVISLKNLGFNYIKVDDGDLRIGATTTLTEVMTSDLVTDGAFGVIHETIKEIRINEIRNMGTIGGEISISAELDLPSALIALEAKVVIASADGERVIPLEDLYRGYLNTALDIGEIVTEIQVPQPSPKTGAAFYKFERTAVDLPIVNAAARITLGSDGICEAAKIVVGAATATPVRAESAEKLLINKKAAEELIVEAAEATAEIECISDIRASGEVRRIWVRCAVEEVLKKACDQAKGGK